MYPFSRLAPTQFMLLGVIISLATLGCQGRGESPEGTLVPTKSPDTTATSIAAGGSLGVYTLDLDYSIGGIELAPVQRREVAAIGDQFAPDITPFLEQSPCRDCFTVRGMRKEASGALSVDFAMKHPFPTTALRADLSVFDTRAIVIMPGTTVFPGSPKVHTDSNGTPDLTILGNFELLLNADGYTSHYDSKPADTAYFNPPMLIPGSVNPYRYFFTEDNPSPTGIGNPIANHRFSQSPAEDVQRFTFALPNDGTTQLRLIVVLEAQYGASALRAVPAGQPGSRSNPVYFLPAFNQLEAYRVSTSVDSFLLAGATASFAQVHVQVEDWQAGLTGSASYGELSQPAQIPFTSDVAQVVCEVPGVMSGTVSKTTPDSGSGTYGNPYLYTLNFQNQLGAPDGIYTGLISVVDTADGQQTRATLGSTIHSFVTYMPFSVTVAPNTGSNNPPVAVPSASPNPVTTGATVNLLDAASYDPDSGDSITLYEWDYDYSGTFFADTSSPTPNAASTSYTNAGATPITKTAALRVRDTGFLTHIATVNITVNPTGSSCNSTAPSAPTGFSVPTFPTPPYNGTASANRITFSWNAVTGDPCVLGYAIYRNDLRLSSGDVLVSDLNSNGTLEPSDAITATSWADTTLSGAGNLTSNKQYQYKVVTVKDNGSGGVVTSPLASAPRVFVFFDDFEDRTTIYGNNGYSGTLSGFVTGMVNDSSYPGGSASGYGWNIATNSAQGNANSGTRFMAESATVTTVGGTTYGPTNHRPYRAAQNAFAALDDGYWNSFGPNLWIGVGTNPLTGTSFRQMQVYHKYQLETYFNGTSQVAAEVGYVAALPNAQWLTGTSQFNDYVYLPTVTGAGLKTYDSAGPSLPPPFLDQWYWTGTPNPQQQIPNMPFFAGDAATPTYGLPNWGVSRFDLGPAASMASPIIMFAHTSDDWAQPYATFGWNIDDICIIAY